MRYPIVIAAATAAVLAGCASAPRRSSELARARAAVEALSSQPQSLAEAGPDLKTARTELHRANIALRTGRPMPEVDHLSYLALRYAEAGQARVAAAQAHAQVASATHRRDQLLLEAQQQRARSAASEAEQAREQVREARSEARRERRQARQTRNELAQAKSQASAAQSEVTSLQHQLEQLKQQQIQARKTSQGMVVTLSNVLFATNRAILQPGAGLQLAHLASYLKAHPQTRVLIEGNTDNRGAPTYNRQLSRERAQAVAQALELRGVSSGQLKTVGLGEAYPVASNSTAAGRQQNRRVDVVFSNAAGRFAEAAVRRRASARR